jgi:hypothetical protein
MECMIIFVHAPISGGAGSKDSETTDNYSKQLFDKEKARLLAMLVDKDRPGTRKFRREISGIVGHQKQELDCCLFESSVKLARYAIGEKGGSYIVILAIY